MARHGARQVAVAALAIIGNVGIGAQNPQPAPTFRSEIDYVQIPVRVLDARGEFVRGLTQSDFQILEDGQPQTITAFSAVDIPFVRPSAARADAPLGASEAIASNDTLQVDGRVYVFVLDNQDMDAAIALKVRQLVRRFIRDCLAANDLAAIVLTGNGRGQSFTYDRGLIDAALERFNGDAEPHDQRIHRTATVIADTAKGMGAIKGRRKALVLVTASQVCSIEIGSCRESLNHALRVSGQSDVSIYAIDGRGLPAYESTSAEHANPNSTYGVGGYAERSSGAAARRAFAEGRREFHGASSGARYLADVSGGFAVVNTNSIDEGFARLVRESSSYYLLGYYSTNNRPDGKLRTNRITTSRRGLRVVYRSGYLAPASSSNAAPLAVPAPAAAGPDALLDQVLRRMHAYLRDYATHLPAMIASEKYEQRAGSGMRRQRRLLESDFGLIQVPGDAEWLGFREVRSVNGKPVLDSASRLAELFAKPSAVAVQQARRIAVESARFNIGPIFRTINDPTMVLELLDPRHAGRMRFTKQEEERIRGRRVWVVGFQEVQRPTIIRTRSLQDQPAHGRAWIEPQTGRIHRVEATIQPALGAGHFFGTIDVTFAHDARLGFAVPAKMTERYTNMNLEVVSSGEATYGNYRRFTVDTKEELEVKSR